MPSLIETDLFKYHICRLKIFNKKYFLKHLHSGFEFQEAKLHKKIFVVKLKLRANMRFSSHSTLVLCLPCFQFPPILKVATSTNFGPIARRVSHLMSTKAAWISENFATKNSKSWARCCVKQKNASFLSIIQHFQHWVESLLEIN